MKKLELTLVSLLALLSLSLLAYNATRVDKSPALRQDWQNNTLVSYSSDEDEWIQEMTGTTLEDDKYAPEGADTTTFNMTF